MKFSLLAVLALSQTSEAFQLPLNKANVVSSLTTTTRPTTTTSSCLFAHDDDDNDDEKPRRTTNGLRKFASKLKKPLAFLTLASSAALVVAGPAKQAHASAPVMAMPKADVRDPGLDALENHERKMQQQAQEELKQYTLKARQIEAAEGSAARDTFEETFKAEQAQLAQERLDRILALKYGLLDQGICPFIDIEGQRQVILVEKGVDLGEVSGTAFNVEKEYEKRSPTKTYAYKRQANREMVKCMVEDMKNRDIDPLEYFKTHQEKTANILELPAAQAAQLASKYRANLDEYGQIAIPKEGEMSAKEKMAKSGGSSSSSKAEAKAKAAAEKAVAKEEKAKAKAEAKAAKEAAKEEKAAAKVAAAAAAAAAAAGAASGVAQVAASAAADVVEGATGALSLKRSRRKESKLSQWQVCW
jgi:membrane-associated HD superfamily phosphohydrolase